MADRHRHKSKYTADRLIPGAFEGETVTRRRFMTGSANLAGAVAVGAFTLPALAFSIGPIANASAGSVKAPTATTPARLALPVMNRRRVTVSPSNAPGIDRSAVYLDL